MSNGLYKNFQTNRDVEKDGVVLAYGQNDDGSMVEIRIARAGGANTAFAKALEAKLKPYRRQMQTETMDPAVADTIMRDVYASTVVLGWANVQDADGKEMEFTKENVIKLFTDLPDLFADIQQQSQKVALFRELEREADAKN